ncbi:MAG TPA: ABC transporter ATP-binding protein [Chitinophagales bacterium]|nr:ABC transporter ATP-binding protein [Chitinophagales bacterium]MCB0512090.1 ABC transporter ATP-binding protein [Bacteroidota bacterium]MCB9075665.1 ABC transporter ATP-binding protein [Chitinophagales bacterium]HMU99037.1 ABC transporter ATP-binding protein [Chitinophagales bacterium]HMV03466.1 ABC transporter ATP-binding protein [Chitinophagales bacterium]
MISCSDIHKSYGQLEVLKGINLQVNQGELVSVVGASGAGKSTLLHIIGTLDKPDRGEVIINGMSVANLKDKALSEFRNKNLGFIFQFHHLLPEFTALENVCIPGYIANRKDAEVQNRAKELLDFMGLKDRFHHKPNELSGGEQQRVSVARALINNPLLILADEPTGNLDSEKSEELHNLFFDMKRMFNQTFIIVTHNEHLAEKADKKIVMKDGLIIS